MKKLLLALSFVTLAISSCADHKLDFNDDRDVITCNDGAYTLTKNSTKEEIFQNCRPISITSSAGAAALPQIEFWADHNARVICSLKKGIVDTCKVKT